MKLSKLDLFLIFVCIFSLLYGVLMNGSPYIVASLFIFPVVYCFFKRQFISISYLLLIVLICILSLFIHDIISAVSLFYSFIGLFVCRFLANNFKFNYEIVYKLFLIVFVPVSICSYLIGKQSNLGNVLCYLPLPENDWRINVIAWGLTIHYTMLLGLLIFVVAFYRIMKLGSKKKIDYVFILLGLYFILFSGSRGGYISLITMLFLFFVNKDKAKKYCSWLILICSLVFIYLMDLVAVFINNQFSNPVLRTLLKLDSTNTNITAGRSWLWNYHLNFFVNSNYMGVGKNGIKLELGELTNTGEIVKAASESPATYFLAAYGLLGTILLFVYLYMFEYALKRKNLFSVMLMGIAITLFCGSGINLFTYINYFSFLFLLLYFSSFRLNKKDIKML